MPGKIKEITFPDGMTRKVEEMDFEIVKENWNEFNDDVLLNTVKRSTKEEVLVMFTKIIKDRIALIAPLTKEIPWNKFGYKYFNPRDRQFFSLLFRQNYLTMEEKQVIDCLAQIY